jgi:hypothetical protein
MTEFIVPCFNRFPNEGSIIGRLLTGYGELEVEMADCVAAVMNDRNTALRVLFRTRGEEPRIQIADAIMRHKYMEASLIHPYSEAIGDMRHCKIIRNQFAHCAWYDTADEGLCFLDLEDSAKHPTDFILTKRPVNVPLLTLHEAYFKYVQKCFWYLCHEYNKWAGQSSNHDWKLPKKLERPPKYNGQT